jgi:hypothetical protein
VFFRKGLAIEVSGLGNAAAVWKTVIYESRNNMGLHTFHSFPSRVNACCCERKTHATVNHVYPIRQSRCSCTSITIHACTTFSIEDGAFSPAFFMSVRRQAKAVPIALPTRSVNNSLAPFSSNRERQLLISPYRHVVVVPHVHFASVKIKSKC